MQPIEFPCAILFWLLEGKTQEHCHKLILHNQIYFVFS